MFLDYLKTFGTESAGKHVADNSCCFYKWSNFKVVLFLWWNSWL